MAGNDHLHQIRTLLAGSQAMQLATLHEDRPRLCSLHFAVDGALNFYWLSRRSRVHSLDLVENPKCAVGMILNTEVNQCLHFEGTAKLLSDEEAVELSVQCYEAKFGELSKKNQARDSIARRKYAWHLLLYPEDDYAI